MVFTSAGKGLIDGQGSGWWGIPGIGYLEVGENRPRLFNMEGGRHNLVENIILKNSPYWVSKGILISKEYNINCNASNMLFYVLPDILGTRCKLFGSAACRY